MAEGIPKAVAAQAEAAEKLQKELVGETLKTDDQAQVEPVKKVDNKDSDVVPARPAEADPVKVKPLPEENFEAKYKVLQGKYDAEVPRLSQQNNQLISTVETQKGLIVSLQERIKVLEDTLTNIESSGAQGAPGTDTGQTLLNPEDFEGYGEEMLQLISMVNSIAKNKPNTPDQQVSATDNSNSDIKSEIESLKESELKRNQREFFRDLTVKVTNWVAINKRDDWKAWLDTKEPLSGWAYGDILDDAAEKFDVERAAKVFNVFIAEKTPVTTPVKEETADDIGDQVVPEGSGASVGDIKGQGEVKYPTREEYQAAVKKSISGDLSEKEFNQLTALFQKGIRLGKVA